VRSFAHRASRARLVAVDRLCGDIPRRSLAGSAALVCGGLRSILPGDLSAKKGWDDIMRIAIMGAGGLGSYIGARLAAAGDDVFFIARGRHLAAMRAGGLRVESSYGDLYLPKVTATAIPAEIGPVDLVLFTVKLWDTEAAAAALTPLIEASTRVITLQNGINSVELIARHVPLACVVAGATYISGVVSAPGVIRNQGVRKRIVVDADNGNATVAAFQASSARSIGLDTELVEAIGTILWEKFIRMSANAAAQSLMRSTIGPILANPESRAFMRQLVEEGVAVAAATGNPVRYDFADETMAFFDTFPPTQRASMAEDLERGRRLELLWLSGRVHALGIEHNISTPAHTAAYRSLSLHAEGAGELR
jgi:2-dehydropantoate 2-reductase